MTDPGPSNSQPPPTWAWPSTLAGLLLVLLVGSVVSSEVWKSFAERVGATPAEIERRFPEATLALRRLVSGRITTSDVDLEGLAREDPRIVDMFFSRADGHGVLAKDGPAMLGSWTLASPVPDPEGRDGIDVVLWRWESAWYAEYSLREHEGRWASLTVRL